MQTGAGCINKKVHMTLVHGYTKIMICSAGWMGPLTSPVAALAGKIAALLWAFQLQG
jgi:hypothetical protein